MQYFFRLTLQHPDGSKQLETLAMLSDYTPPDLAIAQKTHGVLLACQYQGQRSLRVVDAKEIYSVVAMLPLRPRPSEMYNPDAANLYLDRYYVAEKLGFDMTWIGHEEDMGLNDGQEGEGED